MYASFLCSCFHLKVDDDGQWIPHSIAKKVQHRADVATGWRRSGGEKQLQSHRAEVAMMTSTFPRAQSNPGPVSPIHGGPTSSFTATDTLVPDATGGVHASTGQSHLGHKHNIRQAVMRRLIAVREDLVEKENDEIGRAPEQQTHVVTSDKRIMKYHRYSGNKQLLMHTDMDQLWISRDSLYYVITSLPLEIPSVLTVNTANKQLVCLLGESTRYRYCMRWGNLSH